MAGIGEVMFAKALVLSLWAAASGCWKRYKKRYRDKGLELRPDRKTGVYIVHDPVGRIERWTRIALWAVGVPAFLYGGFVVYVLLSS